MKPIPVGARGSFSLLVQPEHLANRFKDAMLPAVFATPVMIMVMENAALNALKAYLDPGESAVGTEVKVRHLAATPVGRVVTGEAEPDHARPAHRAGHCVGVGPVPGQSRDVAARARETADDEKIIVPADQGWHGVPPVEDELRGGRPVRASIALMRHQVSPRQSSQVARRDKTLTRLAALATLRPVRL